MPKMVKRIKLDSETTGTTGAYLTTDLSDKNVVVDLLTRVKYGSH